MRKTNVKVVVACEKSGTPCWPCIDYDAPKEVARIMQPVTELNPDMNFDLVYYTSAKEAEADYEEDLKKYDGVLVLLTTCWKNIDIFYALQSREGLPVIVADVPYYGSGSMLMSLSPLVRREKLPVPMISTLDYMEIAQAVRIFDVVNRMKQTTILVISNSKPISMDEFIADWGCEIIVKSSLDLHEYMERVSADEAKAVSDRWIREALEVREASEDDILESAVLHLALKEMMKDTNADAVTVDCLGLSYSDSYVGAKKMYPCLSHFEMLNHGGIAVCEADLNATVTSLVLYYLTGRPGYVSDPVIDTASNQIIYAHCVGCRKVYGCNDPRTCSYAIRSHAEDKKGASVQIYFPVGEQVTTAMIYPSSKASVIHSGKAVGNVGLQEACRSKLAAETNAEAVLENWSGGWHRVTLYGDWRKLILRLLKVKGLPVIEEDISPEIR